MITNGEHTITISDVALEMASFITGELALSENDWLSSTRTNTIKNLKSANSLWMDAPE
jgi:hypothetical protein